MSSHLKNKLLQIESLVRHAQWHEARTKLLLIRKRKIPDEYLEDFASLCRRSDIAGIGLGALRTIVRPKEKQYIPPHPSVAGEYAACLIQMGAYGEAATILNGLPEEAHPKILFFKALLLIKRWEHAEAIPHLRKYVALSGLDAYEQAVGNIHLALCFLFEESFEQGAQLLNQLLTLNERRFQLIKGNAYRYLGHLEFLRGNYDFAVQCFHKAFLCFSSGTDKFLIESWLVVAQYYISRASQESELRLEKIRTQAEEGNQWEILRDLDYWVGTFHQDKDLLQKVYFGTPFETFRKRLQKKNPFLSLDTSYLWCVPGGEGTNPFVFELDKTDLKPGQALYRILSTLCSDFYRPFSAIDLFESSNKEDYYSAGHAEQRVYQLVKRLREWLRANALPFILQTTKGNFHLIGSAPCRILLDPGNAQQSVLSQDDHRLLQLQKHFSGLFTAHEAATTLGTSRRTVSNTLKQGLLSGKIEKIGTSNQYRFIMMAKEIYRKAG